MIGILNFNALCAACCAAGLVATAFAADVTLMEGSRLTGELHSMDADGTLLLTSPNSEKPLQIKAESVSSVAFKQEENGAAGPDQRLTLINGDVLPMQVEAMDEHAMSIFSETLDRVRVPRNFIDSLQLGVVPEEVVYRASQNAGQWKRDAGATQDWEILDGEFVANGSGSLSREVDLPEKFILRYTLGWDQYPSFNLSFGGAAETSEQMDNSYSVYYTGGGLEIRRIRAQGTPMTPIVLIPRTPNFFPKAKIPIELRVDRSRGMIQVSIDGILKGRYIDPIADVPMGNLIKITSNSPRNVRQVVSGLEILKWNDRGDRHRSEERGNSEQDSLIGKHGERFSGQLVGVQPGAKGPVFEFRSDFRKEPILLPEEEVSTVFFADEKSEQAYESHEGLILRLQGGGEMRVSSCVFGEDSVQAVHPLLGELTLARTGITSLERRTIPKAKPIESQ